MKRIAIAVAVFLLLLAGAGLGAVLWLRSDGGRAWLVREIAARASTPGETELSIGGMTGDPLGAFRVTDIRVRDRAGEWLTIGSAAVDWHPLDLLRGALTIARADIRAVSLARMPVSDPAAPSVSFEDRIAALRDLPSIRIAALAVEDLELGQPVLGAPATLRIAGGIESAAAESVRGRVAVTRVDGRAGSVDATGTYRLADNSLTVEVSASEPAGGLLARALDIPGLPPFTAKARGAGPLADWKGHAALSFERVASGEADLAIRHTDRTAFDIAGTATAPAADTDLVRRLLSGDHRFRVAGAYGPEAVLSLSVATWTLPTAEAGISGRLDLDDLSVEGKATLRKTDVAPLRLEPSDVSLNALALDVTASGKLTLPVLQVSFTAGGVALPGVATTDASGTVSVTPGHATRARVEGEAALRPVAWTERSALTALAGDALTISLAADLDLQAETAEFDRVRVAGAHADLSGTGRYGWKDGGGAVTAALDVPDLSILRDRAGMSLAGRLALSLDGSLQDFGETASATLKGSAAAFSTGDATADAILGREAEFSARVDRKGGTIEATNVSLLSGRIAVTAKGSYGIADDAVAGTYALDIAAGPAVALADAVALDCGCTLSGALSGTVADPRAKGALTAAGLRAGTVALRELAADYDLARLTQAPEGSVAAKAGTPLGHATLSTRLALAEERLRLSALEAAAGDAALRGALDIPLSGAPVAGDLAFEAKTLNALFAAAGLEGEGSAKGTVTLRAAGDRQALEASATAESLQVRTAPGAPVVSAGKVMAAATADDLLAGDRNSIELKLENGGVGEASFERVTATARGGVEKADLTVTGKGNWRGPLTLDAAAAYAAASDGQSLTVSKLQGTVLGEKLGLGKPMRLRWGATEVAAAPVDLIFGAARLTGHARSGEKAADVSLALAGLPLRLVDPFYPLGMNGTVDATVAFAGPWPAPDGTLSLSVPALRMGTLADSPALAVTVDGALKRGRLTLDGKLVAADATPSVFSIAMPLRVEGPKPYVDVPRDGELSARLSWSGETAALWRFAPLPEHILRGDGRIDVTLSGTVAKPVLRGAATLADGFYESLEYGTVLKSLDLDVEFDGQRARITRLAATDGGMGKLEGTGAIAFDAEAGFPFDAALTLKALTAVRRDDVQASASGKIGASGSMKKATVESKLTTDLVEIRVLDRLPPEVATLDVVEVGRLGKERTRVKPERPIAADIDLAIEVEMPRRVFVRGRGIDSEWKGNLKVTGPASAPQVGGYLSLVRGTLTVVGKTFRMESGNVVLPDRANAEPELSVTATYTGRSLTVTAHADGPVTKPEIRLTSSPSLPQDEIVSRVLFDKSTSKLNAYEAAQLGLAIAELSGKGGGGIMDFARRTLGVDVLQVETVETEDGSQPVVGAGKYVTENVYVGVKQGASPESSSVGVEVELTPNIILESDVTRSGQSDVGVKFKYDY